MKCYIVQMYFLYLLQSFLYSYSLGEDDSLVVTTRLGSLRGQLQAVIGGQSVRQFLGIPYAQPPVGPLRFARPKPAQPWDGVRDAVEFGPICPQTDIREVIEVNKGNEAKVRQDEDCLSLNVYTPSGTTDKDKLAVMVWIHGGGFDFGAGRAYNPSLLVALHNVIVVTINYRLGVLGFFNIPGTDIKGNFAMHDQVEAFKWVQQNIASFGGNPDQVTIFGESAGGMSVSSHLFSPLSKGLFHRVIAQSGSCVGPFACVRVTNTDTLEIFSKVLKCDGIDEKLTECLRQKSVEDILVAQVNASWPVVTTGNFLGTVIVDGEFLPDDPESLLKEGKVNKADIITGVTGNEGGLHSMLSYMDKTFNTEVFKTAVRFELLVLGMHTNLIEDAVVFEYLLHDDLNNSDKIRQAAIDANTHNTFLTPAVVEARLFSKAGNRVYMYVFDHSPHQPRFPEWFGAYHSLDIPFIFGRPLSKDAIEYINFLFPGNYSALEQGLSKYVMEMWTNFAKYGDPNGVGVMPVKWPAYNNTGHAHLSISTDPKVKYSLRERKVAFWDEFIPKLAGIKDETAPSNHEHQRELQKRNCDSK